MAVYEYRCPRCGPFDVVRAMGTATPSVCCDACGAAARRAYSAPHVNRTPRALAEALTRAERSREEPDLVGAVPPRRRTPRPPARGARPVALPRW